MRIQVLASGSSGNAIFLEFGGKKLLVDAGISTRRIERGLRELEVNAGDIDAVLVTHEHTDHISGLDVLVRRHRIPVYARPGTWRAIPCRSGLPETCRRELGDRLVLDEVGIEAFSVSHDAADPVGFCFYYRDFKCVVATDLGAVTDEVAGALTLADVVILEANHDVEMLAKGPYPRFLKQRIKSPLGHLSNNDTARILGQVRRKDSLHVFLAHISRHNNRPELAKKTVSDFLTGCGFAVGREILIHPTYQDLPVGYCSPNPITTPLF